MTTININNSKYFDPFLKTLAENTDKNFHTENSLLLAANFGTDQHKSDINFIFKLGKKNNYLDQESIIAKDYIVKDILNNIKKYLKFHGISKTHRGLANKIKARL